MKISDTQLQLYNQKDIKKVKIDYPIIKLLSEQSLVNLVQIYYNNNWRI